MYKIQRNSGCGCGKTHYGTCPSKSGSGKSGYGGGFGCGYGSGSGGGSCPPAPESDVAKSRSTGCDVDTFPIPADYYLQTAILADLDVTIPVEAEIKLPSYASDIKEIRKNVHLTQLKALPISGADGIVTLFVEGYVHKNIQYSDQSGFLRDYSVNIPIKCYHRVTLENGAAFPFFSTKNTFNNEFREMAKNKKESNRCEFGSVGFEFFNYPIEGILQFAFIREWDIAHNFDYKGRFNKITEKMDVTLGVLLTQRQPVGTAVNGVQEGNVGYSATDRYKHLTGK